MRSITIERPVAASLMLLCLLVVSGSAVAVAWSDLTAATDERDANADLLARSVDAKLLTKLSRAASRTTNPFVTAETETLAAAQVDALVRSTATEAGSSLLSSRAEVKPEEGGPAGHIEAQAVIEGSNDALQTILLKIEDGEPLIIVDDLSLEPAEEPGDPQSPRLRMSVTLSAFWKASRP